MKVIVDWTLCDGNGNCTVEAPGVFELDDNDELRILNDNPGGELSAQLAAAVSSCPKRAITLEQ